MQPIDEPSTPLAAEPSRRQPPRLPSDDPIPIPDTGRPRTRTVRIQDVLAAQQRAIDVRLDEGLRELRLAVSEIVRHAVEDARQTDARTPAPLRDDVVRGLLEHSDERFQAVSLRLRRLEDVMRAMAQGGGGGTGVSMEPVEDRLEAMSDGLAEIAASQQRSMEHLAEAQQHALERLAAQNREAFGQLARRTGEAVVAVVRTLQGEIGRSMEQLRDEIATLGRGNESLQEAIAEVRRLEQTRATREATPAPRVDTSGLEQTILAVAERQEAILDRHLASLRSSLNSLHRTMAWDGMARPSRENGKPKPAENASS